MKFAEIDRVAINGLSLFHKAHVVSKLILAFFLLTSLLLAEGVIKPGVIIILLCCLFLSALIPLKLITCLAFYPLVFVLFFAVILAGGSWQGIAAVLFRAVGSAMTMLFLFSTTSYVELFACLSRFLPALLVDIFFFTYRSLFILLGQAENCLRILRLKGGFKHFGLWRNAQNASGIIGVVLLRSFGMSERMYYIYSLRGYNGRVPAPLGKKSFTMKDLGVISFSLIIFSGTVLP